MLVIRFIIMRCFLFFLFFITFNCFSQKHEITFNYSIGKTTSLFLTKKKLDNIKPKSYTYPRNLNRNTLSFTYKFNAFKKIGLSFFSGIDFVDVNYLYMVLSFGEKYVGNVFINKRFLNYKILGASKQIKFFNDKLSINFGLSFIYRFFKKDTDIYKSNLVTNPIFDWIKYSYEVTTYYSHNKFFNNTDDIKKNDYFFNLEYHLMGKAKLNKKLFLNFGFTYTRNFIMFFNQVADVYYYYEGVNTWHSQTLGSNDGTRHGIKNDFLNFNVGLSYKFDKIKFK